MKNCVTNTFRRGMLDHVLASRPKIALFSKTAGLDEATLRYSSEGEVRGAGYILGGAALTGGVVKETKEGFTLTFDSPVWQNATISARGALIYLADDAGRAIRVIDFGKDIVSTNGPFTVSLPSLAEGGVITT